MANNKAVSDPATTVNEIRNMLVDVVKHARASIREVGEPRAQALLETTAEVLDGLSKAYRDYGEGNEEAWRRPS